MLKKYVVPNMRIRVGCRGTFSPKKYFLYGLLFLCLCGEVYGERFVIPQDYRMVIDPEYRKTYHRVTGYEFSGLHWNQWVAVFISNDSDVYKNNHLAYLQTYLNDEDEDDEGSEKAQFQSYSRGTVILKEHYKDKENLPETALTTVMMIKREAGYDQDGGDWEYLQVSKEGQIIVSGNSSNEVVVSLCQDCHSNVAERDYIFSTCFSGN